VGGYFEAEVVERTGGPVVVLRGELDITGIATMRAAFDGLPAEVTGASLRLDCRRLTFVDSTGLYALVRATRRMHGPGRPSLLAPSRMLVRLLALAALGDEFELIRSTVPEAARRRSGGRRGISGRAAPTAGPSTPRRRRRPTARRR
jgi:anti-anti-sigma factor